MNDRHSPIGAAASAVPHWNTLFASARAAPVAGTNWADVLARLFDPQLGSLPPFCIPSILGSNRTPAEAFALASAVACPDLFLFDALPGPGRVPVLATLAAESVQAGNRVLILAEPAQADLIVTRLADRHPGIGVARALAPGESVERLLTASAKRTAAALAPGVIESVRKKLSHARAECDASHQRLEALPAHLETFREFLNQSQRLTDDEAKSRVEHSRVHTEAESAIQSVKAEQLTAMQSHEELLQSAQNLLESRNAELATVRQKLDEATAEAKKRRGALGYLRTLIVGDDGSSQLSELQPRLAEAETAAQNAASEVARLTQLRDAKIAEQTTELARVLQL